VKALKELALSVVTWPGATLPFEPLMRDSATIFMLHRFANEQTGSHGIDPAYVRSGLEYLRKRKHAMLPLGEIFRRLSEGVPLRGCVGFTIDDGYLDHATVAAPLFAALDCPVTTFLATGFLDRQLWLWWDIIEHIFQQTKRSEIRLQVSGSEIEYSLVTPSSLNDAQADFIRRCKLLPNDEKLAVIAQLGGSADVEIPDQPPPQYAPMSWDQARACERHGMSFGPHTVTHPILSRTDDAQSHRELEQSWGRLRQELTGPVPVFCYPNGELTDFGAREIGTLRRTGLIGAVVGVPGHATGRDFAASENGPFMVRRFAFPMSLPKIVQYTSGVERFKSLVRGRY
jgi:peptidoglycan/xylan/chitin deacetylase (PgdA/CDA1 family)